jgi:hypothetical protein
MNLLTSLISSSAFHVLGPVVCYGLMIAFAGPTRDLHPFGNGELGMGLTDT